MALLVRVVFPEEWGQEGADCGNLFPYDRETSRRAKVQKYARADRRIEIPTPALRRLRRLRRRGAGIDANIPPLLLLPLPPLLLVVSVLPRVAHDQHEGPLHLALDIAPPHHFPRRPPVLCADHLLVPVHLRFLLAQLDRAKRKGEKIVEREPKLGVFRFNVNLRLRFDLPRRDRLHAIQHGRPAVHIE